MRRSANTLPADEIWETRWRAKSGYYMPEQLSAEWDKYSGHPGMSLRPWVEGGPVTIAGRYTAKSNIFSLGLVMWELLTLMQPHLYMQPPWPVLVERLVPCNAAARGAPNVEGHSYGVRALQRLDNPANNPLSMRDGGVSPQKGTVNH